MGLDLDNAAEDLKQDPTANITDRARKGLNEVLIVARTRRILKGGAIKELKHAAVMAAVALEVLRARTENDDKDSDVPRQIRARRSWRRPNLRLHVLTRRISNCRQNLSRYRVKREKRKGE